jgi:penicillin-binding protein 1A
MLSDMPDDQRRRQSRRDTVAESDQAPPTKARQTRTTTSRRTPAVPSDETPPTKGRTAGTTTSRRAPAAPADEAPPLKVLEGGAARSEPLRDGGGRDGHGGGRRPTRRGGGAGGRRPRRPQLKKLRLALILLGFALLSLVSTIFGMMMAVAQDLPSLETTNEFKASRNSILLDNTGKRRIAALTGKENRILVTSDAISPSVKHATIAIEDRRFFSHKGVDYAAIARALWADIRRQSAVQGGSTITQQFVKNALLAQTDRSLFQKLKEAALSYQLERKWTKDKILTQYLNTVYFGGGAYGIESAARVYFGWDHPGCEPRCAEVLGAAEAALLAGLIASPSAYSPVQNPGPALKRRNLVLDRMHELDLIGPGEYAQASNEALPPRNKISPPRKISKAPYFSSWVEQQLVDRYGTGATFGGGLEVRTGLDLAFQRAAEEAIAGRLAGVGPSAALVALDNKTGAVRAMVGGNDFENQPFNLATQGHRQPGSAFKPFTLIAALEKGISPGRTFVSAKKTLSGSRGNFEVENYEDRYSGVISLAGATTVSDNSVFAEVGYKLVGTESIARSAEQMGIRTPLSTNPAMVLGGLRRGVTTLETADAYLTMASGGKRVTGSLAAYEGGPVAFTEVKGGGIHDENETSTERVIPEGVAEQTRQILQTVVTAGTGRAAQIGEFAAGKTGTTENYQDAWFVGFTDTLTVAVWVGYPTGGKAMEIEFHGDPVAGGTYPAEIWREFMLAVGKIREGRGQDREPDEDLPPGGPVAPATSTDGAGSDGGEKRSGKAKKRSTAPREAAPEPKTDEAPAPEGAQPGDEPAGDPGAPDPGPPPSESGGSGTGGATGGEP